MPPRKSNVSVTSNGAEDGAEGTPSRSTKDGISVEDLSLPKSMIARLAKGVLPANTQIQKDALLALHKSATVFVSYIASISNENAQSSGKKTISPQDVMAAMKECEFEEFMPRLEAELKKYNETQCDKRNTYRRKVKEDKAAAAVKEPDDTNEDREGVPILPVNGHAEDETDDGERPMKKLKAEDGTGMALDPDGTEDEMDDDRDVEPEVDDQQDDIEDDDDIDDEDDEAAEEETQGVPLGDADVDDLKQEADMRDEALDDPGSDSE